jgi:hypothetical protein
MFSKCVHFSGELCIFNEGDDVLQDFVSLWGDYES